MTLQEAKERAAKEQGFESWACYEEYCKNTNDPLKMIAICDLYATIYARSKWDEGINAHHDMYNKLYYPPFQP